MRLFLRYDGGQKFRRRLSIELLLISINDSKSKKYVNYVGFSLLWKNDTRSFLKKKILQISKNCFSSNNVATLQLNSVLHNHTTYYTVLKSITNWVKKILDSFIIEYFKISYQTLGDKHER